MFSEAYPESYCSSSKFAVQPQLRAYGVAVRADCSSSKFAVQPQLAVLPVVPSSDCSSSKFAVQPQHETVPIELKTELACSIASERRQSEDCIAAMMNKLDGSFGPLATGWIFCTCKMLREGIW